MRKRGAGEREMGGVDEKSDLQSYSWSVRSWLQSLYTKWGPSL